MLRTSLAIGFTIGVLTAAAAVAQPAPASGAQPISQALAQAWDGEKGKVSKSAALMPEGDYNFKPVDTVRTFGQLLAHIAGANYEFCAVAKGEKSPHAEDAFEKTLKTKAEIVKQLEESFAYCTAVYKMQDDKKLTEAIEMPFGMGKAPRAAALINNTIHVAEHYGNLVTYFRVKGMVPPTSQGR